MLTGVLLIVVSVILLVVGLLVRVDKIKPNDAVGLRTRATTRSEAAWYAGNRKTAPFMLSLAVLWAVTGALLIALPEDKFIVTFWTPVILTLPVLAVMIHQANRAARDADTKHGTANRPETTA